MHSLRNAVLAAALCLAIPSAVLAIEPEEVIQLVQSGVDDAVIVNMVNATLLSRPLTAREVMALNAGGASPSLLEFLTRPEVVDSAYAAAQPTLVTTDSSVIVAPPAVVYDYTFYPIYRNYWHGSFYRPYWSWGFNHWWGNSWWNGGWWGGGRWDHRRRDHRRWEHQRWDRWAHNRPRPPLFRPGSRSGVARSIGPRSGFGSRSAYTSMARPSTRALTRGATAGARTYSSSSPARASRSSAVSARPNRASSANAASRAYGASTRSSASGSAAVRRAPSNRPGSSYRAPSGGGRSSPGRIIPPGGGGRGRR